MAFWTRPLLGLAVGVTAALASVVVLYQTHAAVRLDMDREVPAFTSGFYDSERDGELTFAWTAGRAVVRLAGLTRRVAWTCDALIRDARPADRPRATAILAADGASASVTLSGSDFTRLALDVPPRSDRDGLTLSLTTAPVFVPGAEDLRELGVQVDSIGCTPAASFVWPSIHVLARAALGAAVFGLVAGLTSLGISAIVGLPLVAAFGMAVLLVTGGGPFGRYPETITWMFVIAALVPLAAVMLFDGMRTMFGAKGSRSASADSTASSAWPLMLAALLFALELAALSHPGKLLIDAVFQAHRLEWVMGGRYFFTQPLPDGVAFPYAIGLYAFAAPFAGLIGDHVLLVRAAALFAHALAGLLLYAWVWRERRDVVAASTALILGHLAPLVFVVIGNANLPNVFAQAVGTVAFVSAALAWRSGRRGPFIVVVTLAATLACLSHVTTLATLSGTLAILAGVMAFAGGPDGRRSALLVVGAVTIALATSWLLYYQHFPEVYARAMSRVGAAPAEAVTEPPPGEASTPSDRPAVLVRQLTWFEKASSMTRQLVVDAGWPLLVLAVAGIWVIVRGRPFDPFAWTLIAWVCAWGLLLVATTLTRVDTAYQRYAAEFLGRINLAGYPAAAALGGIALGSAWSAAGSVLGRTLLSAAFVAALVAGVVSWMAWFS